MSNKERARRSKERRRMRTGALSVFLLLLPAACSAASSSGFDDSGTSPGVFVTKAGDPSSGDDCADAARLVYVLSQENDLYSFTPNTGTFVKIGRLECPVIGVTATPNSMAVDRQGTAWVNYSDGSLYKVSTTDASCEATGYVPGQGGFLKFGMAFATDDAGSSEETLYISGLEYLAGTGQGFGKIDLKTMQVTMLGDYSGNLQGHGAELTGSGDGHLYGFFTTQPSATLAAIDKASGSTSSDKSLLGVSTGNAWAFSFWGGDFWFYTSDGYSPSRVTQLRTSSDGAMSVVTENVGGFRIVGAGVSTCAPTTPPK